MKRIIVFIYWIVTWVLKYFINFFELLWHLDFSHFSYYGTHFLSVKDIKEIGDLDKESSALGLLRYNSLDYIEKIVYYCVKD